MTRAERLAAIQERLAASRPGPWSAEPDAEHAFLTLYAADGHRLARWDADLEGPPATAAAHPDAQFTVHAPADLSWACALLERDGEGLLVLDAPERERLGAIQRRLVASVRDDWYAYYTNDDRTQYAVTIFTVGPRERTVAEWVPLDKDVPYYESDSCEDPHLRVVLEASRDLPWLVAEIRAAQVQAKGAGRRVSARTALFGALPHGRAEQSEGAA